MMIRMRGEKGKLSNRSVSHLTPMIYYTMSWYYAAIQYKYMSTIRKQYMTKEKKTKK